MLISLPFYSIYCNSLSTSLNKDMDLHRTFTTKFISISIIQQAVTIQPTLTTPTGTVMAISDTNNSTNNDITDKQAESMLICIVFFYWRNSFQLHFYTWLYLTRSELELKWYWFSVWALLATQPRNQEW